MRGRTRRHPCALSTMLTVMAKDARNAALGKLHIDSYIGWALGDKPYTNPQGVVCKTSIDRKGRSMTLTKGRAVRNCPCPPDGPESVPLLSSGYSVKLAKCTKCPHRLPKMCCAILRKNAGDPFKEMANMIGKSVEEANKMLGRVGQP